MEIVGSAGSVRELLRLWVQPGLLVYSVCCFVFRNCCPDVVRITGHIFHSGDTSGVLLQRPFHTGFHGTQDNIEKGTAKGVLTKLIGLEVAELESNLTILLS